jgi:hypothetical protein
MSNITPAAISGMMPLDVKGPAAPQQQKSTKPFEKVLQDGSTRPRTTQPQKPLEKSEAVSAASVEQLRTELTRRLSRMPSDAKSLEDVWPELLRTGTHMTLLREAMKGVDNTPTGTNLKGMFGKVEGEWFNLEQVMKSDKDLSTGELLGLQARLYQVSQHIDVMSKVVDQMTGGIKTILNTNV